MQTSNDMEMFATCLPGLASVLSDELTNTDSVDDIRVLGNDGRSDVVSFTTHMPENVLELRCAEDIYATVAEVDRAKDLRQIASTLIPVAGLGKAETTYANTVGRPLRRRATARIIARVTDERNFRRTDLRYAASRELSKARNSWHYADPAEVEVWLSQTGTRSFVSGLRLSDKDFRQRNGRASERHGALRPSVAAALVRLAGMPSNRPVLDPCCGSGTILSEALASGWQAIGSDHDETAVDGARRNVPCAQIKVADGRSLPFDDSSVGVVVTNLPFWSSIRHRRQQRCMVRGGAK